jgi:hypothetical protein
VAGVVPGARTRQSAVPAQQAQRIMKPELAPVPKPGRSRNRTSFPAGVR